MQDNQSSSQHETYKRNRFGVIAYTISVLLGIVSLFMLSGILVAIIYKESELIKDFIASVLITGIPSLFGYFYFRRYREENLITRDGFLV